MIKPGSIQPLPVKEVVEKGYLLGDSRQQVFIPKRDLKPDTEPGELVEVFTFL
jgi:predicted RNA-binding protein (virulence factor B family)